MKKRRPSHRLKSRVAKRAKQQAFLKAFAECGTELHAANMVGIPRRSVYDWKMKDAAFKAEYDAAQEEAVEALENEARRRALKGVPEPVFYQGVICGTVQKYSDTLLIFLLNAARPEKYRSNQKGEGDSPPVTIIVQNFAPPAPQPVTIDQKGDANGSTQLLTGPGGSV